MKKASSTILFICFALWLPLLVSCQQGTLQLTFGAANVVSIDPDLGTALYAFNWATNGGVQIWASAVLNQTANNGTNPTLGNRPIQLFLNKNQAPTLNSFLVSSNQTTDKQEVLYATTKQMTQGQYFLLVDSNVDGFVTVTINAKQIGEVGLAFGDVLDDEEVDALDQVIYHFSWTQDNVQESKSLSVEIRQLPSAGSQSLAAYLQKGHYPTPTSNFRSGNSNGTVTSFQIAAANMSIGDWYLSVVNSGSQSIEYELIISDTLAQHSTDLAWNWKSFFVGIAVVLGIIVGVIAIFVAITIAKNQRRRVDVVGAEDPNYSKLLNQH